MYIIFENDVIYNDNYARGVSTASASGLAIWIRPAVAGLTLFNDCLVENRLHNGYLEIGGNQ